MTIQEVLKSLRVEFKDSGHHHCRPGWVQVRDCPFCGSKNYHLGFNVLARFFTCWRCRYHHTIPTLIRLGATPDAARDFYSQTGKRVTVVRERAEKLKEPPGVGPMLKCHKRYLEKRGFEPDEVSSVWGVKGIGLEAKLRYRLYIPIFHQGVQVSWTTRAIGDKVTQRYISASAKEETMNHKELIYGMDMCHQSIIAVEGPTDAWAIGPGAGALFGTAFTMQQVEQLARFPYRFVCFDNSKDAQRRALEIAYLLTPFAGTTVNVQLDAKDPGSASQGEIRALRKLAYLD